MGGEGLEASLLSQAGHLDLATPGQADQLLSLCQGPQVTAGGVQWVGTGRSGY